MGILITCVGGSDPIRGYHDGPILNIFRNYYYFLIIPRYTYIYIYKGDGTKPCIWGKNRYIHHATAVIEPNNTTKKRTSFAME